MNFKIIMLLLTLSISLITAVPAHAAIEVQTYDASLDFSLFTTSQNTACACTLTTDYFTLSNTGSFTAIYYLTSDAQLSDTTFELNPGESKNVQIFIQSECSPKIKTYRITAKSNVGVEKTIEKNYKIERCQNLELRVNPEDEIKACRQANYNVFIKNTGNFPEEYSIKSNNDEYMSYSSNYFTLLPEQTAQVNATLKFPCEISGEKNIEFTAYAIKNKLSASSTSRLNILPDYNYDIIINGAHSDNSSYRQSLDVCNRVWYSSYPITIKNRGVDNEYTIKTDGLPKFARIEGIGDSDNKFILDAGQSKTFYIVVDSHDFRDEYKGYDFSLNIDPKLGNDAEYKLRLELSPCYEHTISIIEDSTKRKPIDTCSEGFYEYDVTIKNNGKFTESMKLKLEDAPLGVSLSRYSIVLKPQDTQNLKLYIQGPESNYLYNIKITAELDNKLLESDDMWIKAYDKQSCHNIEFGKSNYKINYQHNYIEIALKNTGLYTDVYDLELNDTRLVKLEEDSKNIEKETDTIIRLNIDSKDMPEGIYKTILTAEHNSGAKYSEELTIQLKDKSPLTKAFEYMCYGSQCRQITFWQVIAIIVVALLIILFSIIGPHYPYNLNNRIKQKIPVLIVLASIFIIALLAVIIFVDTPKTNREVYGINTSLQDLRFEMLENEQYTLNAGQFFSDPDGNNLRYETSTIKNIKTTVEKGKITFTPDYNWHGTRTFTITAYDNLGESTQSPEMTIKIIDVPRKSMIELYNIYCAYANLVLLLILLFLIFIAFIIKQQRRRRGK
ncbi:MAG: Ig-like domain-containing protein [Candidatus Woesearchaeota archaeon]